LYLLALSTTNPVVEMMQWGILLMVVVMKINRKKVVPPHSWGFGVESAMMYKCRSVQSAQEYTMYFDTDAKMFDS